MKTAAIFPGQGSQFIGMGQDFYQKYHVSKEIFDELEDILGRRIIDLIFRGENFELSQTENSQTKPNVDNPSTQKI